MIADGMLYKIDILLLIDSPLLKSLKPQYTLSGIYGCENDFQKPSILVRSPN